MEANWTKSKVRFVVRSTPQSPLILPLCVVYPREYGKAETGPTLRMRTLPSVESEINHWKQGSGIESPRAARRADVHAGKKDAKFGCLTRSLASVFSLYHHFCVCKGAGQQKVCNGCMGVPSSSLSWLSLCVSLSLSLCICGSSLFFDFLG